VPRAPQKIPTCHPSSQSALQRVTSRLQEQHVASARTQEACGIKQFADRLGGAITAMASVRSLISGKNAVDAP
jgi:hypothetical protein